MRPVRLPYVSCRFTLEGFNLERFVNAMGKAGIPLLSVRRAGERKLVCLCYQADMPAIETLAQEKGWKLTEARPVQLAALLHFLRQRWGIPLGFFLMIALCVTLYQFVWRVEIRGSGAYLGDISAYLLEENIRPGIPKTSVDARALAQKLNHRYPDVAWFTVYVHDMTLVVDCALGVPAPKPDAGEPGDIVALRDGIVVSVLTYAGTPAVKAGDIVREGQVLIRGQERTADEGLIPVKARGEVWARCWRSHSVRMPVREVQSAQTGRAAEAWQVCTPWFSLPASPETPDYLAYDTEVTITPLVGSLFPVWVRRTVCYEVSMEYVLRDAERIRQEAGEAALQGLADSLRGYEMIDKWVDYCMIENNLLSATATAEWLMDIGGSPPP